MLPELWGTFTGGATIFSELVPVIKLKNSLTENKKLLRKLGMRLMVYTPVLPFTISVRAQLVVAQPGSFTLILSPLQPVASTQCPPLCTFKITMLPASRFFLMSLFPTKPLKVTPNLFTAFQTQRSSLTQPPLAVSHLLRVLGFIWVLPTAQRAMAEELMRQPAEQMVLEEVPSFSEPHLASHCLYMGKLNARVTIMIAAKVITLIIMIIQLCHNSHHFY